MTGLSRGSVALAAFLVVGCVPGVSPAPQSAGPTEAAVDSPSPAPSPSTMPSPTPVPYEEVEFAAEGGPTLRGRVWSEGPVGVVLAHGFSTSTGQGDWDAFAGHLAGLGYGVLTFDFRGFCDVAPFQNRDGCSEGSIELGENWRDAAAAVEFLRSRGSERIVLIGASMGGLAAFRAADEAELDLAGIVSLATPQWPSRYYEGEHGENNVTPERLQRIAAPKLFIAGADDVQTAGEAPMKPGVQRVSFADDARAMFDASPEPRQLEIVDSGAHSSELVIRGSVVEHTRALIVAFIEEHA
jgi:pimeloyl-ACP methyl ester carboxylesterase